MIITIKREGGRERERETIISKKTRRRAEERRTILKLDFIQKLK
jgi:hypothetical protein